MKYSGGAERLVDVVEREPQPQPRRVLLGDGEELTSARSEARQTFSDATQTTEDEEATLRELLMR